MYEYRCEIVRVVDGDTVDINIDLGFGVWLNDERVRLMGVDTPESRTSDKVEKLFGYAEKAFVEAALPAGSIQQLATKKYDSKGKFGRILGDFLLVGEDGKVSEKPSQQVSLVDSILQSHNGVVYSAQNKELIKEQHMANRAKLVEQGIVTQEQINEVQGN
jgi:micrococcal nuclease